MDSFNEYLGYMLTDCRNNALEELRSHKRYAELKQVQDGIRAKLEATITPEAQTLLEDYTQAVVTLQGLEFNKVLLCGLTAPAEIRKRFDASTPEYAAFADEYL